MSVYKLVFVLMLVCQGSSIKVLLIPGPGSSSHLAYFTGVGQELLTRGHEVGLVVTDFIMDKVPEVFQEKQATIFPLKMKLTPDKISALTNHMADVMFKGQLAEIIESFTQLAEHFTDDAVRFLDDEFMMKDIESQSYDIALIDVFPPSAVLYTLPYRLNIPYCTLATPYVPELLGAPALPSFLPMVMGKDQTDKMTFIQRVSNFFSNVFGSIMWRYANKALLGTAYTEKYAPNRPPKAIMPDLIKQSEVWLINSDPLIDFHKPLMSNIIHVGGLTVQPAKPLAQEFQQFIADAKHGVIVVSFGSILKSIDEEIIQKMVDAFSNKELLSQHIIWRYGSEMKHKLPSHIMVTPWLPQNDLLAHPSVKLFITHCGNNGQFEALYHGVPMLGMPFFGDQPYNSLRMQNKGYGLHLDVHTFTTEQLLTTIHELTTNASYTNKIQKASRIFRAQGSPRVRAVDAIEHVATYGSDHLRPPTIDMPQYQLWMIDIYIFLTCCILLFIYVVKLLLKFIFKRLFGSKNITTNTKVHAD